MNKRQFVAPATEAKKQSMSMWMMAREQPRAGGHALGALLAMLAASASMRAFQLPMKCRREAAK